MKLRYKRDFEEMKLYYETFWNCGVLDRVAVSVTVARAGCPPLEYRWSKPTFLAKVGHTDLHGRFDALAVLRGGADRTSINLIENPEGVKEKFEDK